jgi:hypothetical protein
MSGPNLGHMTRFLLLSGLCCLHVVGRPPWREDVSVIYSYISLSLSSPSPAELMTTSCCFIWYSHNLKGQVPVFISPGTGWPILPGHWFPFCRLLRLAGPTVGIFYRLHTGHDTQAASCPNITSRRNKYKRSFHQFFCCYVHALPCSSGRRVATDVCKVY